MPAGQETPLRIFKNSQSCCQRLHRVHYVWGLNERVAHTEMRSGDTAEALWDQVHRYGGLERVTRSPDVQIGHKQTRNEPQDSFRDLQTIPIGGDGWQNRRKARAPQSALQTRTKLPRPIVFFFFFFL